MPETDSKIDCVGTDKKTWRAERRMAFGIKAILFAREDNSVFVRSVFVYSVL